jgi:hypothetical protein
MTKILTELITEQANAIAAQAEAIRDGKTPVPLSAAKLVLANAETLVEWLKLEQAGLDHDG